MAHSSVNGLAIVVGRNHYQAAGGIGKEAVFAFAEAGAEDNICADLKGNEPPASPKKVKLLLPAQFQSRRFYGRCNRLPTRTVFGRFCGPGICKNRLSRQCRWRKNGNFHLKSKTNARISHRCRGRGPLPPDLRRRPHPRLRRQRPRRLPPLQSRRPALTAQTTYAVRTKRFGEQALSRGAIVHVASAMAFGAVPCETPYITAKHALLGITRASAMDPSQRASASTR
ncbi:short-chain dehydrogenase/reductase family protein [Paraphaeosphaeria sporulosa]